jgi:hypothetical protein
VPTFSPPVATDLRQMTPKPEDGVGYEQWMASRYLFRHYRGLPRGRSVLKIGGVYRTVDSPSAQELEAASEAYIGGHIYQVSDTIYAALLAAGYVPSATTWNSLTQIWNNYGGTRWDSL